LESYYRLTIHSKDSSVKNKILCKEYFVSERKVNLKMEDKEHLRLKGDSQLKEIGEIKFNYGAPPNADEKEKKPYYGKMAKSFQYYLKRYFSDLKEKYERKDIDSQSNIDYILIQFQSHFVINKYYQYWFNSFGLEAVRFTKFNIEVLFAIINKHKFEIFINNIESFINFGLQIDLGAKFDNNVKYIKKFKLFTTLDIIKFREKDLGSVVNLNLIDLPLDSESEKTIRNNILEYLKREGIKFSYFVETNKIEILDASYDQILKISNNFDLISSITCSLSSLVKPSEFNSVKREYGFRIVKDENENLPIIGILDTGISQETPLSSITIQDEEFSLNAGSPLIDSCDMGGHGTAIGALAALGIKPYKNNFSGDIRADAELLSIKILSDSSAYLSEKSVVKLLYDVKKKYPQIRFFVLTTCYFLPKGTNESYSAYTYDLDKFAYETDSLIFICTGNNEKASFENNSYDPNYFLSPHTNLCTPADSMNNITIGSAADNIDNNIFLGVSDGREFPTLYTRKCHIDLSQIYPRNKTNKHLFKPDVLESGGDYEVSAGGIGSHVNASLKVLSANPAEGFYRQVGTSFSTPLVANLAAKIIKKYPSLNNQTIKALIINGSSLNAIRFQKPVSKVINKIAGNGFTNFDNSINSNDNRITTILEDKIKESKIKLFEINFPKYLIEEELGKQNGILKLKATICYKFKPIANNHLSYCPLNIGFALFKNHTVEQIIAKSKDVDSKFKSTISWTQSGRYKSKPIPFSNSQKIEFPINQSELVSENSTLKLAVHCTISDQLLANEKENYPTEHEYSIVISVEESIKKNTNRLYNEFAEINNLESIAEVEIDTELEI